MSEQTEKYFEGKLHELIEAFTIFPAQKADPILLDIIKRIALDQREACAKAIIKNNNKFWVNQSAALVIVMAITVVENAEIK